MPVASRSHGTEFTLKLRHGSKVSLAARCEVALKPHPLLPSAAELAKVDARKCNCTEASHHAMRVLTDAVAVHQGVVRASGDWRPHPDAVRCLWSVHLADKEALPVRDARLLCRVPVPRPHLPLPIPHLPTAPTAQRLSPTFCAAGHVATSLVPLSWLDAAVAAWARRVHALAACTGPDESSLEDHLRPPLGFCSEV